MKQPRKFSFLQERLGRYFAFIRERHSIYIKRFTNKEPWPWTDDPILRDYKFTNIFRELDRVTIWVRENIREPYADHPELFFNLMMARLFNWPPTLAKIGFVENWDRTKVFLTVEEMRFRGEKFTTGAYMLTGTLGEKGTTKDKQLVDYCLHPLWQHRRAFAPVRGDTLESAFNRIAGKTPGFGPFIAYEVITDLRHTRYLRDATDIMEWANPGPGAVRGVKRLLGMPHDTKGTEPRSPERNYLLKEWPTRDENISLMRYLLEHSREYLPAGFPEMEMRDIEHSLCEFDKFERLREGGRVRARFIRPDLRTEDQIEEFPSLVK